MKRLKTRRLSIDPPTHKDGDTASTDSNTLLICCTPDPLLKLSQAQNFPSVRVFGLDASVVRRYHSPGDQLKKLLTRIVPHTSVGADISLRRVHADKPLAPRACEQRQCNNNDSAFGARRFHSTQIDLSDSLDPKITRGIDTGLEEKGEKSDVRELMTTAIRKYAKLSLPYRRLGMIMRVRGSWVVQSKADLLSRTSWYGPYGAPFC